MAAAAVVITVAGCMGPSEASRVSRAAPSEQVLRQLCGESYETAYAQFATAGNVTRTENSLGLSGGDDSVECQGDGWTVQLDGERDARVEMALIFNMVEDPADPADDYCDTVGVNVSMPYTDFEERQFDGHPYCFSWYRADLHHAASASYVDRSTEVYLAWSLEFDGDAFDTGTEMGSLFSEANDAVLARIYAGFGEDP